MMRPVVLCLLVVVAQIKGLSQVTSVTALSPDELCYRDQRLSYVQTALHKNLQARAAGANSAYTPTVAVCISGGGLRAMIGGLGFLQALHDTGLFDLVTYICGLSGSTWGISGFLQSGRSISDYITALKPRLQKGLLGDVDIRAIIRELVKKIRNNQTVSLDDIWGSLIAQKVLCLSPGQDLTQITLDAYLTLPADGSLPLPIYTCVSPLSSTDGNQGYRFVEWTPYDIRCPFLQTAIPLSTLGSRYSAGQAVSLAEPLSLSFAQGVWGSAISADIQDLLTTLSGDLSAYEQYVFDLIMNQLHTDSLLSELTSVRALPARLPNWNYLMSGAVCSQNPLLTFVDAGMLCNLPLPPVLDPLRSVDIIIVVDLTEESNTMGELSCMQEYAHANGLPFPPIDTATVSEICSVHPGCRSSHTPTIIYFPLVPNPAYKDGWNPLEADFTSTLNLRYTPKQVDLLSGLLYTACQEHMHTIQSVIALYALT